MRITISTKLRFTAMILAALAATACDSFQGEVKPESVHFRAPFSDLNGFGSLSLDRVPIRLVYVPDGGFDTLKLKPMVGRFFNSGEKNADPPVAVLRDGLAGWLIEVVTAAKQPPPSPAQFIGQTIKVNQRVLVIIGIAGRKPLDGGTLPNQLSEDSAVVYVPVETPGLK